MTDQPGQCQYDGDLTPAGDGQQHRSRAIQYEPHLWFVVSVLATVFAVALVSGRTALAEGVPDRAQLAARLTGAVTKSLNDCEQVTIEGLSVEVESGILTLEGKVATSAEKHLAARRAGDVTGVRGVVNAIDVDEALKLLR